MALELTHYEISKKIRESKNTLDRVLLYIRCIQRTHSSCEKKLVKYTERLERLSENDVKRETYNQKIQYYIRRIEQYSQAIHERRIEHNAVIQQMEQYELMKGMYLSPISSQPSQVITLIVRLLSGELLEIVVDRSHPIIGFADQFAKQHNYDDSVTSRMVFLIMSEEEEEKHQTFWSPEERHDGKSIGDILGTELPILNLIIRSVEDPEREQKIILLRKILYSLNRNDSYSDEYLFDFYCNWRMKQRISSLNRYQKMKMCIEEHPDIFNITDDNENAERSRRMDLIAFRQFIHRFRPYRHNIDFGRDMFQQIFQIHGYDIVLRLNQITWLLRFMTFPQMFEMGLRVQNIPTTWKYYRFVENWDYYTRESEQM